MGELRENILRYELQKEVEKAKELESKGKTKQAGIHYLRASAIYRKLALISSKEKTEKFFSNASQYESVANTIRNTKPEDRAESDEIINSLIVYEKPSTTWNDIGGLEEAKKSIKESIILPFIENKPPFIDSPKTILLYGPPGTGKTLLAKAASNTLNANFFEARASALLSKYYGESSKLINALFQKARQIQPSIIFMDEIDSIALNRKAEMNEATRRVIAQLLTEIEGFNTKREDKVIFMAATNKPWDLDDALVSRFSRRIYVPLPDLKAREEIFKIHLRGAELEGIKIEDLAKMTENFSGRDIANICREAIIHMVREQNPDLGDLTYKEIERYKLNYRSLTERDFKKAFERVKPVTDEKIIERYVNWEKSLCA